VNSTGLGQSDLFIFNSNNRGYLTGVSQEYEGKSALYRTLRWFVMTSLFIGIPGTAIVTLFYSLILKVRFVSLFPHALAAFLIIFGILAIMRFRRNSRINKDGRCCGQLYNPIVL
jgi:hypothetical protein